MDANNITDLIGKEVYWPKTKQMADIVGYASGWVTIKTDDGQEHKVRAKDITLMNSEEELTVKDGELVTEEGAPDPSTTSSGGSLDESGFYHCECGAEFTPPRVESFRCPECGAWHMVRLHPNLEHYVKGLDVTESGRDTVDINDPVANYLRGYKSTQEQYKATADYLRDKIYEEAWFAPKVQKKYEAATGTLEEFFEERYGHLNRGMIKMNLSNVIRGALIRHQTIQDKLDAAKEANNGK